MSKKQDKSIVCLFFQTLVKPTTFLWLPKFLLELLVRMDVFWCEKCSEQGIIIIIITIITMKALSRSFSCVTKNTNEWSVRPVLSVNFYSKITVQLLTTDDSSMLKFNNV